jgi:hypothetical protein
VVLVDTSVWITHLRSGDAHLRELLESGWVACHPYVIGELACGQLDQRAEILEHLQRLPVAGVAEHDEALHFIERHRLWGGGLGFIDVHLLASACLEHAPLWTRDKHLAAAAETLGVAYR